MTNSHMIADIQQSLEPKGVKEMEDRTMPRRENGGEKPSQADTFLELQQVHSNPKK